MAPSMRPHDLQADAFDLALLDDNSRYQHSSRPPYADAIETARDAQSSTRQRSAVFRRLPPSRLAAYSVPLLAAIAPLVALLALSPRLSREITHSSCTPSGEFVLPFTASLWDLKRFFEITIPFSGPYMNGCTRDQWYDPLGDECDGGYSFTQVKVIDLAWDVLVGRGMQVLLVFLAYRLFSRITASLMEHGEVGFDLFAAVAFNSGTFSSWITLVRHTIGLTPVPRTRRAAWVYLGMATATLYIICVPSLISAITGYIPHYSTFIRTGPTGYGNATVTKCFEGLLPVWGKLSTTVRNDHTGQLDAFLPYFAVIDDRDPWFYWHIDSAGAEWIDYYERYRDVYDECPSELDIQSCKAAHQKTTVNIDFAEDVGSPMPGIIPFSNTAPATTHSRSKYTHWLCGRQVFNVANIHQFADVSGFDPDASTGICQAGARYAWGFSFLFTLCLLVLNLAFTLLMYALEISAMRHAPPMERQGARGQFKDAVTLVTQAQGRFGGEVAEWSSEGLRKRLYEGERGMSFAARPDRRDSGDEEAQGSEVKLGDGYGGDWGGHVVIEETPRSLK